MKEPIRVRKARRPIWWAIVIGVAIVLSAAGMFAEGMPAGIGWGRAVLYVLGGAVAIGVTFWIYFETYREDR